MTKALRHWITYRLFDLADALEHFGGWVSHKLTGLGFAISPELGEEGDISDLMHNITPTSTPFSRSLGDDK